MITGGTAPPVPEVSAYVADKSFLLSEGESLTSNNVWYVRNIGDIGSSLTYSLGKVHESPLGGNSDWLTISPSSGSLTKSGSSNPIDYIDLTANTSGLTSGVYVCTVNLTCNDPVNPGPFPRTVTLTVDPPPGPDWDVVGADFTDLGPWEPGQNMYFSVDIKNIGDLPAPASRLKAEAHDRDTGGDQYIGYVDVPALAVNESVTLPVPVWVGPRTTIIVPKFTANADDLAERNAFNNESGIILAVIKTLPNRLWGNTEEKTGISEAPVNLATGNHSFDVTDLSINGRIDELDFSRSYNSDSSLISSVGRGWRHSFLYEMDLSDASKPGVIYPDGRSEYWKEVGGQYLPHFITVFGKMEKTGENWTLTQKDLTAYNFDSIGKITSIVDPNGNTTSFAYTGANLTTITDPAGRVLSLTYTGSKLTQIQDWTGRHIDYGYTGDNLSQVTDENGNTIIYRYDASNRLDRTTDQRGNHVQTIVYNSVGRVVSETDALGNTTSYAYNTPSNFQTTITNANGDTRVKVYNESFQLIREIDELGHAVEYTYDSFTGLRNSVLDAKGNLTSFVYDSRGNLLKTTHPDGAKVSVVYDAKNLPVAETNALGHVTYWAYDSDGNVINETDALSNAMVWTYNAFGQKLTEVDKTGATATYT